MKLLFENWRQFLRKGPRKKEPEEEEADAPSSMVTALMKRGGLSREEAEEMAKQQIDLEEEDNLEQNLYSFDFDNTLIRYHTLEDGDVEYLGPHEENIALLKDLAAQGNKVIIVTSRSKLKGPKYDWDKAPTPEEAIQEFGLPVEEVHYTYGNLKADKLMELGVTKHWDDDDDEVAAAWAAGIEAVAVPVEGDVTDQLRDKWKDHLQEN